MKALPINKVLPRLKAEELAEHIQAWARKSCTPPPAGKEREAWRENQEKKLRRLMRREGLISRKRNLLSEKLVELLDFILVAQGYRVVESDLTETPPGMLRNQIDVETAIAALERAGFIFSDHTDGKAAWLIPAEVGNLCIWLRRREELGLEYPLTLRSHLERLHFINHGGEKNNGTTRRNTYRLLAGQTAVIKRLGGLSSATLKIVETSLAEHGGIVHRSNFRSTGDLAAWQGAQWRAELEEKALGTVKNISLVDYGIDLDGDTLILFLETGLAWFRQRVVHDTPARTLALASADLVSNLERVIDLGRSGVLKLTTRGLPHRWAARKIDEAILPMGGNVIGPEEAFRFLIRYCWNRGLIEKGKDSWHPTQTGEEQIRKPLDQIILDMLAFAVSDTESKGESYHQVRMRRHLLRFFKRLVPGKLIFPMDLPFLARNAYLAGLDALTAREYFENRVRKHIIGSMESTRRMSFHLQEWMIMRLHLLGLLELGYDEDNQLTAFALSARGGALLNEASSQAASGTLSNIVVNPDFEILLFPEADQDEAVHFLDRFARRTVSDLVFHFQLTEDDLKRGLNAGLTMAGILSWLEIRSRTPLPRNILWSLKEWGDRAGLVSLQEGFVLKARTRKMVEKLLADPDLGPQVLARPQSKTIILNAEYPRHKLQKKLNQLGFMVEN